MDIFGREEVGSGVVYNFGFADENEGDGSSEVADIERLIIGVEQENFMFGHWNHLM